MLLKLKPSEHWLIKLLLLVIAIMPIYGHTAVSDTELWKKYKTRFILPEGRVVDTGNNNISHSEGQSYAMLLAVHNDDEKTFRLLWNWTEKNLAIRDDGLFAWRYIPDQEEPVEDRSNSTDADLIIAWAMLRAGKRWNSKEYLKISRGLLRSIRENLTHKYESYTLILPGPQWPIRKDTIILNPSYWVYPALRDISTFDPDPVWEQLTHSGIRIQQQTRFGTWELPSDWIAMKSDGSFHQDDEFPFMFAYDAVRIPLYMIWGGHDQKDLLRIYQAFWASTARGSRLVTTYGLSTNSIIQQENVLAFQAIRSLVNCTITGKPATTLNNTFHKYDDYYSATIFLITRMAAAEQSPSCLPGTVQAAGSATCHGNNQSDCPLANPIKHQSHIQNTLNKVVDYLQPPASISRRPLNRFSAIKTDKASGQSFIASMDGQVWTIENGKLSPEPILNLAQHTSEWFLNKGFQTGLTSFTLHPEFSKKGMPGYGLVYTSHTEKSGSNNETPVLGKNLVKAPHHIDVITEWRVNISSSKPENKPTRREVLRIQQPYPENNITYLGFDPNESGKIKFPTMYIGVGDGGIDPVKQISDPLQTAQNLQSPLGKILRIQPQTPNHNKSYVIPKDNPFLHNKDSLPEIWAYGFHRPVDITWEPGAASKMLILDQGNSGIQEVNLGIPGGNYGWSLRQGTFAIHSSDPEQVFALPKKQTNNKLIYPIIQYDRDEGSAIGNGVFYLGTKLKHLHNHFVFSDFANGKIYSIEAKHIKQDSLINPTRLKLIYNGLTRPVLQILNDDHRADLLLGTDAQGELLIITGRDGMIRKLEPDSR